MRRIGQRRHRRGVTLVELLFGMSTLLVGAVWLMAAYQWSVQLAEVSQQSNVALNDLRDMMERIKTTPFASLTANFPNNTANGPGGAQAYTNVVGGYSLVNEAITVTHTPNTGADPREMTVTLTWTNRNRTYQRALSTIRASQAS